MKKIVPITCTVLIAALAGLPNLLAMAGSSLSLAKNIIVSPAQAAGTRVYNLRVDGMTCPFCAKTSEKALRAIPGVKSVSTNLKRGVISVCATPSARLTAPKMQALFARKGFTFRSMSTGRTC